jgi:hypothetical protein
MGKMRLGSAVSTVSFLALLSFSLLTMAGLISSLFVAPQISLPFFIAWLVFSTSALLIIFGAIRFRKTLIDRVHFTVTARPTVRSGESFVVNVWAHLGEQREAVLRMAREISQNEGDGMRDKTKKIDIVGAKGPVGVARGTELAVHLRVEGMLIEDPFDSVVWHGEIGNANFAVSLPEGTTRGPKRGLATIRLQGLPIAKIHAAYQPAQSGAAVGLETATAAPHGMEAISAADG